jgi:hypothetical protein
VEGSPKKFPFQSTHCHDAIGARHKGKQKRLGDFRLTSARPLAAERPVGIVLNRVSQQMVGRGQAPECDEWNAAHENLIVTRHGRDPFGATVPQLSRLTGSSAPCVCTRLGKLADMGPDLRADVRAGSLLDVDSPRPRTCNDRPGDQRSSPAADRLADRARAGRGQGRQTTRLPAPVLPRWAPTRRSASHGSMSPPYRPPMRRTPCGGSNIRTRCRLPSAPGSVDCRRKGRERLNRRSAIGRC